MDKSADHKPTDQKPPAAHDSVALAAKASATSLPFRRRFPLPTFALLAAEALGVLLPVWLLFSLGTVPFGTLARLVVPVGAAAWGVWVVVVAKWLIPVRRVIAARTTGQKVDKAHASQAFRILLLAPQKALLLRTALFTGAATVVGWFLHVYQGWPTVQIAQLAAVTATLAYVVSCIRAVWWETILASTRDTLFVASSPLRRYEASHFRDALLIALIVVGGVAGAQLMFTWAFLPVDRDAFLQLQTYVPVALGCALVMWTIAMRVLTRPIRRYALAARGEVPQAQVLPAASVFEVAQRLPYRLALVQLGLGFAAAAVAVLVGRFPDRA